MTSRPVGIVAALQAEADVLLRRAQPRCAVPLGDGCSLLLSGMGPDAARAAAQALVKDGAQALVILGVAGALEAGLRNGMLICPGHVLDERGRVYSSDTAWSARLREQLGAARLDVRTDATLLSLPTPLPTTTAKQEAHARYAAAAVDMESAAVAAVAAESGLPFMALRAIVDERDDELPSPLLAAVDAFGRPVPARLIAALARNPAMIPRLPALSSRMNGAIRALRATLAVTGPRLAMP
ncbi:phosphorylase family protein [Azotobacter beijerinckii]|uniref:phosphorylase family protein n=1 Tax=Azotobacter beijerinckii TaxID=170623 RepID=UPI002955B52A|nr:purine and other phosphorylase-like protein, family 1 [Azotobacter beijerinckii]MDV7212273.1 purine and other phosphorylase-like protein, family 1 [Azotobacter beijerinckii]